MTMKQQAGLLGKILAPYPDCPLCGSDKRRPFEHPARDPSPYTKSVAAAARVSTDELFAAMPLHTCAQCNSHWHDPWFTPESAAALYSKLFPVHRAGWIVTESWARGISASFLATRSEVWRLLRAGAQEPMHYAEFNCPLNGLMWAELDARHGASAKQHFKSRFETIKEGRSSPAKDHVGVLFRDTTFLFTNSPMCWGINCRPPAGVSCRELSSAMHDRTMTLEDAEVEGSRFDLVSAWSVIDHTMAPRRTLERLLTISRLVLLELHLHGWTDIQHLYNASPRFFATLDGVHARDLTELAYVHGIKDPPERSLILLLSRSDDLKWLDRIGTPG